MKYKALKAKFEEELKETYLLLNKKNITKDTLENFLEGKRLDYEKKNLELSIQNIDRYFKRLDFLEKVREKYENN